MEKLILHRNFLGKFLLNILSAGVLVMTGCDSKNVLGAEIVDSYIEAVITNDSSKIGQLMGLDSSFMEVALGKAMGSAVDQYWRKHPQKIDDFKWIISTREEKTNTTLYDIELYSPDYGALAKRENELLGFGYNSDGVYVAEDTGVTAEEAERQARADLSIKPLHFRVPLKLIRRDDRWIVDPNWAENAVLFTVIRRGDTATENLEYLVKP